MKRSVGYEIHHEDMTIVLTKKFSQAAGQRGSDEYEELLGIKADFPTYTVCLREIKKAAGKQTYRNLTYEAMETIIKENAPQYLADFEDVKGKAPAQGNGAYTFVKKWFLDNFKETITKDEKRN